MNTYDPWNFSYTNKLYQNEVGSSQFFDVIEKELPSVFTRQHAAKVLGGIVSPKTLANLDSLNQGPSVRVRVGSKVGYEKESFMRWLKGRVR